MNMARLCIRIVPNPNSTDPSLDVMRTQEGDVVCVTEDGHVWSKMELACGQYRFIDVPGVSQEAMIGLIASTFDTDEKMLRLRAVTLNIAALKTGAWKTRKTATKEQIESITVVKV